MSWPVFYVCKREWRRIDQGAYLGGRFVVGVGRVWPHDLRFFTGGFLSDSFLMTMEPGLLAAGEAMPVAEASS